MKEKSESCTIANDDDFTTFELSRKFVVVFQVAVDIVSVVNGDDED